MPIYEYQCTNCEHHLEVMQKFSDEPLKDCPACHKPDLQKLISSSAFHLKGGGWYVTDVRDKGKPKSSNDASPDSGETKTDTSGDKSSGDSSSNSNDQAAS